MSDLNISKLETEIQVYSKIYYDGLSELVYNKKTYYPISDEEFDEKLMMLSNLDPENEILSMTGFGFDTIIADNNGDKVDHEYPVNGIAGDRKKKSFKFTSELIDEENYDLVVTTNVVTNLASIVQLNYDNDEKETECIKSKIKIREEMLKQLGSL